MMKVIGDWLKNNFEIVLSTTTILVVLLIAILRAFGAANEAIVSGVTMGLLALVASILLMNHRANSQLHQKVEELLRRLPETSKLHQTIEDVMERLPETSELHQTIEDVLERLPTPSTGSILKPFEDYTKDIKEKMKSAREVWILTRTGYKLWSRYNSELRALLCERNGEIRLMIIDPDDGAVTMVSGSALTADQKSQLTADMVKSDIRWTLGETKGLQDKIKPRQGLRTYTIDYLPAWTLVLIDPDTNHGLAYVELGTFRASVDSRPTFVLRADTETDRQWFDMFQDEYEAMWTEAEKNHAATQAGAGAASSS